LRHTFWPDGLDQWCSYSLVVPITEAARGLQSLKATA
jgi:hypothetical protein